MNNFSNVATFDVVDIIKNGFKDVSTFTKSLANNELWTDKEFSLHVKNEVVKYYSYAKIMECLQVDFNEVNFNEVRSALK